MSEYSELVVYLDGEFVAWNDARIHVFSPAVKYGAAVFEGIRGYWNEEQEAMFLFRLEDHMRRMELSQKIMRFGDVIPAPKMMNATVELMRRNAFRSSVHIRPTVYVSGIGESSAQDPIGMFITAIPRGTPKKVETGCRAQISSWQRIADNVMPARAKANGNYNNSRYAGIQALKDGYDSAILLNNRGKISEGQGMCLFLIRNGVAVTPSATSDILESITRDTVIRLLQEKKIRVQERDVDRSELFDASEAFFCGTGAEITPIVNVDGDDIGTGAPGEITRSLQSSYFDLAFGRSGEHREWLTEIRK